MWEGRAQALDGDGEQQHPAQDGAELCFRKVLHHPEADADADDGRGQHAQDLVPERVLAKGFYGTDIAEDQEREKDAGADFWREGLGHQGHREEADAGEAAFGEANAEGG